MTRNSGLHLVVNALSWSYSLAVLRLEHARNVNCFAKTVLFVDTPTTVWPDESGSKGLESFLLPAGGAKCGRNTIRWGAAPPPPGPALLYLPRQTLLLCSACFYRTPHQTLPPPHTRQDLNNTHFTITVQCTRDSARCIKSTFRPGWGFWHVKSGNLTLTLTG